MRRQALIMGFSDAFAVIGVLLAIAHLSLLAAKRGAKMSAAGAH